MARMLISLRVCVCYRLPPEFWRILHAEYGIIVYPSALTEPVDLHGLNTEKTFTDCYCGHIGRLRRMRIVMYGKS